MKSNKKVFILILVIVALLVSPSAIYQDAIIVFAHYKGTSKIRGREIIEYTYAINHKKYDGHISKSSFSTLEIDSLKKGGCIKVEVSRYFNSFNKPYVSK
jgi:hypothetical protein